MPGLVIRSSDADSLPLPGAWVLLHEVTSLGGEALDSQLTDVAGRFVVRSPRSDSGASYLVSVSHHGIAYFSAPFRAGPQQQTVLYVYDTSSVAPAITLRERHVIVQPAEPDGAHRVIELIVLENAGRYTRVSPDTSRPVWEGSIPDDALEFEIGPANVSEQAVYRRGNRVAVSAPVPPGERQILMSYMLPRGARTIEIFIDQPTAHLNLLIADTASTVAAGQLTYRGWEQVEGIPYRRFDGESLIAGTLVTITLGDTRSLPEVALWILVPAVGLSLIIGLALWWRRAPHQVPIVDDPAILAVQIAALDAAHEGKPDSPYEQRRAELKARLIDALARREQRS